MYIIKQIEFNRFAFVLSFVWVESFYNVEKLKLTLSFLQKYMWKIIIFLLFLII